MANKNDSHAEFEKGFSDALLGAAAHCRMTQMQISIVVPGQERKVVRIVIMPEDLSPAVPPMPTKAS